MSTNHHVPGWQSNNTNMYGQASPVLENNAVNAAQIQDSRKILASFPFASATPSAHVTRHLSSLSISAQAPSYFDSTYYSSSTGITSPYSEFSDGLAHISSTTAPSDVRGREYWTNTRNDAIRLLGDQSSLSNSQTQYSSLSQWNQSPASSSFQAPALAVSVMQHTIPHNVYPTPPPPNISSSSSLANALGDCTGGLSDRRQYQSEESTRYFNTYLDDKKQTIGPISPQKRSKKDVFMETPPTTPALPQQLSSSPLSSAPPPQTSPDPLAVISSPLTPVSSLTSMKRKIKPEVFIMESPTKKREYAYSPSFQLGTPPPPSTPTKTGSSTTDKKKIVPYVEISTPTNGWWNRGLTPLTNKNFFSSDDLGGYGSEDGLMSPNRSGKRTGDRAPLEKLEALFEDIRQAEDAASDLSLSDLPSEFFSPLTFDATSPLLHPNLIRKLTKYISNIARPTKRLRLTTWDNMRTPGRTAGMSELATETLSRVMKSLERSVKVGEDLEPFVGPPAKKAALLSSSKGGKKKKAEKKSKKDVDVASKRSKSPKESTSEPDENSAEQEEGSNAEVQLENIELTEEDFAKLERALETARDSVLAADCCIALLGSDRLDKQLYSEDLITSCLATIKNQLTKIIYPFVETSSVGIQGNVSALMQYLISANSHSTFDTKSHRRLIGEIFQVLSAVFPHINNLVNADVVAMSDSIIIPAVYIAIGPFFVVDNGQHLNLLGNSSMRGLRMDALSLIRSLFANHDSQRSWIIEEILSSLIKLSDTKQKAGQFRLRDGRSIRTVSALLLQLVQTSAHNVRIEARRIAKARQQQFALRRQESLNGDIEVDQSFLDERDQEEIRMYTSGLEAPSKAAKTIVLFLTQRSGKSKTTKNTNEAEYRTILDNLISDLLVILFWPEWPAASLVLSILCKFMISSLDDIKSVAQNDNNASKALALDHLGVIAGRLRGAMMKFEQSNGIGHLNGAPLKAIDEILSAADERQLERLVTAHEDLSSHLSKRSSEDQAFESARELTAIMWGQELAGTLNNCSSILSDDDNDHPDPKVQHRNIRAFGKRVKSALRDVWTDAPTDVFDTTSQEEIARIDRIAEELGTIQNLKNAFDPILNVILLALDAPPVFMRTKALRALSQILTVDPNVLSNPSVRRAIESHLLDSSPAVRDAAVELIGKYMIDSPVVAGDYYQKIAERVADTGLGVRKRVIKLLKSYYGVTSEISVRTDICTKLVFRMLDEDETVRDLAVKTLEELWFSVSISSGNKSHTNLVGNTAEGRAQLLSKVSVIMGVSGAFKDRQSPLEDILHKIVANAENADALDLKDQYTELCDLMIDGLLDASDLPGFTVVNCIKTVHLLVTAYPPIVSATKASTLLPYLKNPTSAEEQVISDYILKIFRMSIPHMPKTAAKFGNDVQRVLQPMVLKPSPAAGLAALQETVACLCAVVRHLTHDFVRLVNLLKSCNGRIEQFIKRPANSSINPQDLRALTMVIYIVSLLGEHSDFDKLRLENEEVAAELKTMTTGSIIAYVYNNLLRLYDKYKDSGLRGRLLQCLGFLFRAQPTLMTLQTSATMMDAIFSSSEEENRGRLLKIMQEFLISESSKHLAQEKEIVKSKATKANVNMEELVGNTHGFAESGVSSAIVQRYLNQIHEAALSPNPPIQSAAVDILSFTIKQGLAHPLQSFPIIIALETSPINSLSTRANTLHSILHSKHASLLNAGYVKAVRYSFNYQKKLCNGTVQGYRMQPTPTALLHKWYSLVREKRPMRQDFLKAIVKIFDVGQGFKASQDDIEFTKYMAENIACFEYKTQEEVLTIINYLTSILSTTGMQLVEVISPSHLLSQLRGIGSQHPPQSNENVINGDVEQLVSMDVTPTASPQSTRSLEDRLMLMRTSVIVGIVMLLKAHLKVSYGLTEEKCSKWIPGKKNAIGDKLATKRRDVPISWNRMPFATEFLLTTQDMDVQQKKFLEIWNEDGATAEPETNEWE